MKIGRRIMSPLYLDPGTHDEMKRLSQGVAKPRAVLLREAVEDLLRKYRKQRKRKEIRP